MYKILFILFFLIYKSYAQDTTLFYIKNSQKEFIKNYKIKFNFYKKGDSLTYYSNEKAEIYLPSQLYKKADSIKASYSFYKIKLTEENFVNNTIYIKQDLSIDEVVLKAQAKKKYFVGPYKKPFFFYYHEYGHNIIELLSFKNDIENSHNLKGMRFAFKNGILFSNSGGKRIEILLIGFNTYSFIPKKNKLLKERIIYKIPKKTGKWVEVDLTGKIKEDLPDYEYIAFGFKVIDSGVRIKLDYKENHPNLYSLEDHYYNENLYDIDLDTETFPLMQLIYEQ